MQVFEVGGRDVSVCSSCLYVMSADDGSQVSSPPCPSFRRESHLVSRSTLAASSRNPS